MKSKTAFVILTFKSDETLVKRNLGMKEAFWGGAEWVMVVNDDVEVSVKGMELLKKILETEKPGILGLFPGYLEKKRWSINPKGSGTPDFISGSFFVLHKKVYDLVQGFYPDFYREYADADVCLQATKAGFPLHQIELPGIKYIKKELDHQEYYLARNHLLFVERQAPMIIKFKELFRLPYTVWEYKFYMNTDALRGVFDFIFTRFGKYN